MKRSSSLSSSPVVVLIEPEGSQHRYGDSLSSAGFHVVHVRTSEANVARVLKPSPSVVAAELIQSHAIDILDFVRRFRENPEARLIPFILYGQSLARRDIEDAARAGAMWLQLDASDGSRLAAAARGLISASHKQNDCLISSGASDFTPGETPRCRRG
jgi:hypothetical protein